MRPIPLSCLLIISSAFAVAEDIVRGSSFGYDRSISPNSFGVPGWTLLGEGFTPQILSDKVILTPPYGGNRRGAVWAENKNTLPEWSVDFEFRVGGVDRASGNLIFWYVSEQSSVKTSSIYTVGKWDGFALVIDTHAGSQKIRGFLNDGTVEYVKHSNVDSLAFGHCDYNYRNLGRPSSISIKAATTGLEISVDGNLCFSTAQVTLPNNYNFGLTAASGDPPDSFEVFKFLLKPTTSSKIPPPVSNQQNIEEQIEQIKKTVPQPNDAPASQFTTSTAHFEDLHSRLHLLSKSITNLFAEITKHTLAEEQRYNEILARLPTTQSILQLDTRLSNLDRTLKSLENELKSSDHKGQFAKLSEQLAQTNLGMTEHLPNRLREYVTEHTPRVGFIVFSFIGFQCLLVGLYVVYKRRRWGAPKKYL